jgi:cytosine/adenosine deaminase-related metal-dependent hydrolase
MSSKHDLLIHTHASENAGEVELVRMRTGMGNMEYLDRLDLLSERSCVAHGVLTGKKDWAVLAERKATIVHCPSSNMRLRSGVAPVVDLRRAGVRVALGSDGASCNDRLDPFTEMRLATFLQATRGGTLSAFDALRMATVEGARALRLSDRIGLEPGGLCDLAILDPEAGWALPDAWNAEPYGTIVFAMGRENVAATIVDGVVRYRPSDPTVGGLKPSPAEVRNAAGKLKSRMGSPA